MRYRLSGVLVLATAMASGLVFSITGGPAGAACTTNCPSTAFSNMQVDNQSTNASEPKILQSPNGNVFINAPAGLPGPSDIWRFDATKNAWDKLSLANVGRYNVTIGGGDSDLAADANGHLYLVDLWLGNSSTAVSTNNGDTWTGQPFGTVPVQDRPWVSADPRSGHIGTVYSVTDQPGVALWLSMAQIAGLPSNPAPGVVYPASVPEVFYGPSASGLPVPTRGIVGAQPPGNLVTDMNGVTYNVYANGTGVGISVLPAGWPSSGVIPTAEVVTASGDASNAFPVVAVDNGTQQPTDKNVYVVWTDGVLGSQSAWNIDFARSTDGGVTWSSPITLGQGVYPWITADAPGKVDVAWYSANLATNPHPYGSDPNAAPANTQWDVAFSQSLDATTTSPTFSTPVAAITNVKTGAICTQGTSCAGNRELGDFMSITHDKAGNALLAYVFVPSAGTSVTWFAKQTSGQGIG